MARRRENAEQAAKHNVINHQMDQQQKQMKAAQVAAYKEQLDSQVQTKAAYRAAGNMTAAEKQLNRDDLYGWKKYDNNQYAMIPGFGSQKQFAEVRPKKSPLG